MRTTTLRQSSDTLIRALLDGRSGGWAQGPPWKTWTPFSWQPRRPRVAASIVLSGFIDEVSLLRAARDRAAPAPSELRAGEGVAERLEVDLQQPGGLRALRRGRGGAAVHDEEGGAAPLAGRAAPGAA